MMEQAHCKQKERFYLNDLPSLFKDILQKGLQEQASDIHLSVGMAPVFRLNGDLQIAYDIQQIISAEDLRQFCLALCLPSETTIDGEIEFIFELHEMARFRGSVFRQQQGNAMVLRRLSSNIPNFEAINAPPVFKQLLQNKQGLILLTGATGSGKTTTLAAMLDYLNNHSNQHIICLEDPVEYVHRSKECLIHQRQIGRDSSSFFKALRAALRQDPDIILIGEMRDTDTIVMALRAAETGHLVLATLHTQSAAKAINRIVDYFDSAQQGALRAQLSQTLLASIWQQLYPCQVKQGAARVAAWEILINSRPVSNLIRNNKIEQIESIMQCNGEIGMRTMSQSLAELKHQGVIG